MGNRNLQDEMEEKFRSEFDFDQNLKAEDWNTPSNEVWRNIEKSLEKDNDKGFAYWYILGVLILILGTGSFFWLENREDESSSLSQIKINKDNSLQSEPIQKQSEIDKTFKQKNLVDDVKQNNQNVANGIHERNSQKTILNSSSPYENNFAPHNSFTTEHAQPQNIETNNFSFEENSHRVNEFQEEISSTEFESKSVFFNNNLLGTFTTTAENSNNAGESVKKLQSITGFSLIGDLNSTIQPLSMYAKKNSIPEPKIEQQERAINFSALVGAYIPDLKTTNEYASTLAPFEFEYENQLGIEAGVGLQYKLSDKWYFKSGLLYSQQNYSAAHNSPVNYKLSEEVINNNNIIFQTPATFATGLGTVDAEVDLTRSTVSSLASDENLNVSVAMNQKLHYIVLPVQPSYQMYSMNGLNVKLQPSLQLNFLAGQNTEVSSINTNHSIIQNNNTRVTGKIDDMNDVQTNAGLSIAISSENISPVYSFSVEPYYFFQNNSLLKNNDVAGQQGIVGLRLSIIKK